MELTRPMFRLAVLLTTASSASRSAALTLPAGFGLLMGCAQEQKIRLELLTAADSCRQ